MRSLFLMTALGGALLTAQAAGMHRLEMGAPKAMQALLWTPCAKPAAPLQMGPYQVLGVKDCPVNARDKRPLVVISHGHSGAYLSHHDLAEVLADNGFVVLAINHSLDSALNLAQAGTFTALDVRPSEISQAISHVLNQTAFSQYIDAKRIGFFGFSRGAYTGLVLAGAQPDFLHAAFDCSDMRIPLCQNIRDRSLPPMARQPDRRIKAYVLADPLNAFPAKDNLQQARAPIQLWASERGGDGVIAGSVQALGRLLPTAPDLQVVPGAGHFAFLAPCSAQLAAMAPEICTDPAGFDRAAFHRAFRGTVCAFFKKNL